MTTHHPTAAASIGSHPGEAMRATDELHSVIGNALNTVEVAIDHLENGVQFDQHDTYTPLATRLSVDLVRVTGQLRQWQLTHGYLDYVTRHDALIAADHPTSPDHGRPHE